MPKLTEAEALRATMDPRDRLIENLYEQVERANLRTIALARALDAAFDGANLDWATGVSEHVRETIRATVKRHLEGKS